MELEKIVGKRLEELAFMRPDKSLTLATIDYLELYFNEDLYELEILDFLKNTYRCRYGVVQK